MILAEVSPNRQEPNDTDSRKRSHDEFSHSSIAVDDVHFGKSAPDGSIHPQKPISISLPDLPRDSPPPQSSPPSLTDALCSTPARNSPSPNPTPTRSSPIAAGYPQHLPTSQMASSSAPATGSGPSTEPAPKRRRLTPAEKAAKAEDDARLKQEREERKRQKEEEKKKRQAERAKADQDREESRAAKLAEKAKKEEEDRKTQEEKEKKERSQLRLNKFFAKVPSSKAPTTPKKGESAATSAIQDEQTGKKTPGCPSPEKSKLQAQSVYDKMFQPFFIKDNVSLAIGRIDTETKDAKGQMLDEYLSGKRGSDVMVSPFNPVAALQLPPGSSRRRGRLDPSVKELVAKLQTSESAAALAALREIPMKCLYFKQDVRPAYCGTVTGRQHKAGMARIVKLARRPNARVLDLQYDYDSEAEWQDDEQGEDLDDADEDEDDEDEDDMDGFLDDSEDSLAARRLVASGGEPQSTGICFEGSLPAPRDARPKTYKHRLEFIHAKMDQNSSIDPYSTSYWESEPKKKKTVASLPMPPPPTPISKPVLGPSSTNQPPRFTHPEHLGDFKQLIATHKGLTKAGFIDVLYQHFRSNGLTKDQVKRMVDSGANRTKGKDGEWRMYDGL